MELDAICYPQAPVKIEQVSAAAQKHVLAIVDSSGPGFVSAVELIRCRAPAEERPGFIQGHPVIG